MIRLSRRTMLSHIHISFYAEAVKGMPMYFEHQKCNEIGATAQPYEPYRGSVTQLPSQNLLRRESGMAASQ